MGCLSLTVYINFVVNMFPSALVCDPDLWVQLLTLFIIMIWNNFIWNWISCKKIVDRHNNENENEHESITATVVPAVQKSYRKKSGLQTKTEINTSAIRKSQNNRKTEVQEKQTPINIEKGQLITTAILLTWSCRYR